MASSQPNAAVANDGHTLLVIDRSCQHRIGSKRARDGGADRRGLPRPDGGDPGDGRSDQRDLRTTARWRPCSTRSAEGLKPRVICNGQLATRGRASRLRALHATQCRGASPPRQGDCLSAASSRSRGWRTTWVTADTAQVSRYWQPLPAGVGDQLSRVRAGRRDRAGSPARWRVSASPRATPRSGRAAAAARHGERARPAVVEYLTRALAHLAPLTEPADLAWLLASYARDALARVEARPPSPALVQIKTALEQALGLRFEGRRASTSSARPWCRRCSTASSPPGCCGAATAAGRPAAFDWQAAGWYAACADDPHALRPARHAHPARAARAGRGAGLDRRRARPRRPRGVLRAFEDRLAVQYFYEPFLEAFDPELRKQLGVWYTPPEVVRYMVERVDAVLREELGIADGLADERVYVLDPCCGTGSFLVEVLDPSTARLRRAGRRRARGPGSEAGGHERVFGFEIMPAPFVIAHLQLGLLLARRRRAAGRRRRARRVYLTNALTGWREPTGRRRACCCPSSSRSATPPSGSSATRPSS